MAFHGKTAWDGEWISAQPLMSKDWMKTGKYWGCEKCKKMSLAPHWLSIKTKKVLCKKCFTPEQLK